VRGHATLTPSVDKTASCEHRARYKALSRDCYTGAVIVASAVEIAAKKLESDDRVNNHDEHHEQRDMQQWNHRH